MLSKVCCISSPARRLFWLLSAIPLVLLIAFMATPTLAHAQAQATATRDVSIDVYGAATTLSPHFGPARDIGYTVGGDIEKHFRLVDVAIEGRYISATGNDADENSLLGGVRAARTYGRFHPYLDLLIGHGNLQLDHPEIFGNMLYTHDDSTVYDGGIGLDYRLTPRFGIKVDAQVQRWHTGVESQVFNPNMVSVGVIYHVPFRYLRPRRY